MKAIKMKTMEEILDVISENVSRIEFTKIYDGKGKIIFDLNTDLKKPENAMVWYMGQKIFSVKNYGSL